QSSDGDDSQWQLCGEQHRQAHPAAQLPPGHAEWTCVLANLGGLTSTAHLVPHPAASVLAQHPASKNAGRVIGLGNFQLHSGAEQQLLRLTVMPLYAYISAVYMPVLELALLGLFFYFAPRTRFKLIRDGRLRCRVFPELATPDHLRPAKVMVAMGAVGKTTDYLGPYLLCMPLQYACWPSSPAWGVRISSRPGAGYRNRVPGLCGRRPLPSHCRRRAPCPAESVDGGGRSDRRRRRRVGRISGLPGGSLARHFRRW
uniref:RSN1_7TM domain-containing protein n=1 Tax=Macrostomum lignano TaxID=282301 RepID=A0A1I8F8J2_9PLAT